MRMECSLSRARLAVTAVLVFLLFGCAEKEEVAQVEQFIDEMLSSDEPLVKAISQIELNKSIVQRYKQSQGIDEGKELLAPGHTLVRPEFQNLVVNAEDPALAAIADPINIALPDRVDVIEEIVAEGNIVGIQTRITGTHLGNLYGIPPTGKSIDIVSAAFYKLEGNKIVESWEMADEAGLLRQLGEWLPERSDGKSIAPPINAPVRDGNDVLAEIMANPEDSDTYTNKIRVSAYKSADRPEGMVFEGRPYEIYVRSGFYHVGERGRELGQGDLNMSQAFPDRRDQVGILIAEGDMVMIQFLLAGTNTGSLYGNPPSNERVGAWEVGVHRFEGTYWKTGWWMGDDIGMMLQIDAPREFMIP